MMADHDVSFTLPERELGKADIEFKIRRDGNAYGRLRISNGSLVWIPANKTYGWKMSWTTVDEAARQHGEPGNK
jgi:hypothetical protein